jgi:hypothetical protein
MKTTPSVPIGNGFASETAPTIGNGHAPSPASVFDDLEAAEARDVTATAPTRRVLTRLSVKRPEKAWFFRTHPEFSFQCWLYEDRDERETYYVWPQIADELTGFARLVLLRLAITRQGTVFIFPVKLQQERVRACGARLRATPLSKHKSAGFRCVRTCRKGVTRFTWRREPGRSRNGRN